MDVQEQRHEGLEKVAEMVKDIKFAMMTTEGMDGTLRSRPMATMQMDAAGCLWFFTRLSSLKVEEAERHHEINLSYSRPDKQDYLSISGSAEIVRDKDKMKELWSPWVKPWFPNGLDDPDLILMRIRIDDAEYWDAPGSMAKRLYGLAKGIATGNTDALGEHRNVQI
ncbi:pyridoxamine 5'-phosphate oxidase family protein [Noviherbaspirillum massiliense]|uniref:pyridoxamine 5'-phosphate oxidase family protein n=1 Tax=Noviherbaspirillum massiliense TaxID=1465823 RepID=UPI0002F4B8EA|nr:pyridoxamine 5'-phosphate oxidase family protein [Noviherbaspirillum massiliense]